MMSVWKNTEQWAAEGWGATVHLDIVQNKQSETEMVHIQNQQTNLSRLKSFKVGVAEFGLEKTMFQTVHEEILVSLSTQNSRFNIKSE